MSDAGGNFISENFKDFCTKLKIEQATSSSYHYQNNGEVETCIKFFNDILCEDTNPDPHVVLLQIRLTPLGQELPSPGRLLFNDQITGIMPILNRPLRKTNDTSFFYN